MLNEAALKRYHTPIAWGLLVLALLLATVLIILPLVQASLDLGQKVENGYQQLGRLRQISTATPELMTKYEQVQQQGLDKLFYPAGMTSAQVAKELQKTLTTVITRADGVLVSSEVVDQQPSASPDATQQAGYQQVTVKAVFQSSTELLREVLHQAYRARPLIFVDSLDIKPVKDDGAADKQVVRAEVKISTYWHNGEAAHEKAD